MSRFRWAAKWRLANLGTPAPSVSRRIDGAGASGNVVEGNEIGTNAAGMFKAPVPDALERPAFPQIASALYYNVLQYGLSPATRAALNQAASPQEWNALYLSSPEFMR